MKKNHPNPDLKKKRIDWYVVSLVTIIQIGAFMCVANLGSKRPYMFAYCVLAFGLSLLMRRICVPLFDKAKQRWPRVSISILAIAALCQIAVVSGTVLVFYKRVILHNTPVLVLWITVMIILLFGFLTDLASLKRVCRLLFEPVLLMMSAVFLVILIFQTDFKHLSLLVADMRIAPKTDGIVPVTAAMLFVVFATPFTMTRVMEQGMSKKDYYRATDLGSLFAAAVLTLHILLEVLTLGYPYFMQIDLPYYTAINIALYSAISARMDLFVSFCLTTSFFCYLSLSAQTIKECRAQLAGGTEKKSGRK